MMTKILYLYENYVLPRDMNISRPLLIDLKRQEFEDRKKMLNPY